MTCRGAYAPLTTALLVLLCAVLTARPAKAIDPAQIPQSLRDRLPEFILALFPASAFATLSIADLEEYAEAWEKGEMLFVNEVRCEDYSGPLTPEQAALVLQVPPGAPFLPERFLRVAKRNYGSGQFSRLEWQQFDNHDGSLDLVLSYDARGPETWIPDISYGSMPGWLYGVRYQNTRFGGEAKSLVAGIQFSENYQDEPLLYGSYTDSTIANGRRYWSISANVGDEWRRRLIGTPEISRFRDRKARLDFQYGDPSGFSLGGLRFSSALTAGIATTDHFVIKGDPTLGGTAPRSDAVQDGMDAYIGVSVSSGRRDLQFTPSEGHSVTARAEQHLGDNEFSMLRVDARKYIPVGSVLGIEPDCLCNDGCEMDIKRFFPTASLALQAQAVIGAGDLPYIDEIIPTSSAYVRGYPYDRYYATKLLGARAEYRFALNRSRSYAAFVFADHASFGESLSKLESLDSYGAGTLLTLPIYGGIKAGVQYARSFDGAEDNYSLALHYQF